MMCASTAHLIPGWRERAAQLCLEQPIYVRGTESRVKSLIVPQSYSHILGQVLHLITIWDPAMRPDPINMVRILKDSSRKAAFITSIPANEDEVIPPLATKDHSSFGHAPIQWDGPKRNDDTILVSGAVW